MVDLEEIRERHRNGYFQPVEGSKAIDALLAALDAKTAEVERLAQLQADTYADYLRRHKDACDRYLEITDLKRQLAEARKLTAGQANDDGLWFDAKHASEAYLQKALRKLHAAIEGTDDFGNPLNTQEPKNA